MKKNRLISEASNQIAYLQDAVDLEIATDEEKTVCAAWKKYRILLNRINVNDAPNIVWPEKPSI
ncbi:tail fiber assembly protein [Frischella sp. Ac48]|uniref:tail fiber assembly protein n=1 Tax=Frischella sp. Ac48 TaxID=2804531 RepID=UPI001C7D3B2E|nr:tail fiber assembly protein [Frischella sp. Ac48]